MDLSNYQTKSVTPVDEYHCTLSEELQKFAFDELGETEEKRQNGIREMREWIMSSDRIEKCRMDSIFLLRYLRFRKYDVPKAKEAFERYLIFREGLYGVDWFSDLNYYKRNVSNLFEKGLLVVFPNRDKFGRRTLLARMALVDPNIPHNLEDALTLTTFVFETLFEEEETQIRGMNYIMDISNITIRHYFMDSLSGWIRMGQNIEKTCAARHKRIVPVNVHPTVKFAGKLALRYISQKLRQRVTFCSSFDDPGFDVISKAELPVECGGQASIDELLDPWKKILLSKADYFVNVYNSMKVRHSAYPKKVLKCDVSVRNTPLDVLCAHHQLNANKKQIKLKEMDFD